MRMTLLGLTSGLAHGGVAGGETKAWLIPEGVVCTSVDSYT